MVQSVDHRLLEEFVMYVFLFKRVGNEEWHVCNYPGDLDKIRKDVEGSLAEDASKGVKYEYLIVQLTPVEKPVVHNITFEPTYSF
jgi:hypothetical protein